MDIGTWGNAGLLLDGLAIVLLVVMQTSLDTGTAAWLFTGFVAVLALGGAVVALLVALTKRLLTLLDELPLTTTELDPAAR